MYSFWSNAAANYIIEEDNISTIGYIRSHRTVSVSLQNNFKFVYKGNLCRKLTYEVRRSWERNFVATKCRVRGKLRTYVLLSVTQLFNPWNFKYTVDEFRKTDENISNFGTWLFLSFCLHETGVISLNMLQRHLKHVKLTLVRRWAVTPGLEVDLDT